MQKGKYWGLVKSGQVPQPTTTFKSVGESDYLEKAILLEKPYLYFLHKIAPYIIYAQTGWWWRHKDWSKFQSFSSHFEIKVTVSFSRQSLNVNRSCCLVGSEARSGIASKALASWLDMWLVVAAGNRPFFSSRIWTKSGNVCCAVTKAGEEGAYVVSGISGGTMCLPLRGQNSLSDISLAGTSSNWAPKWPRHITAGTDLQIA